MKLLQSASPLALLLIATLLEVSGDAVVRSAIYNHSGASRVALFVAGGALLFGYGTFLNLTPLATFFVVWQVINFIAFRVSPTPPILVGGALIIAGGAVVTFWKTA